MSKPSTPLSTAEEVKIVAMLARGDSREQIVKQMNELGRDVLTTKTVTAVKKRNKENLDMLKAKLIAIEEADALSIKRSANKIIKKRLSQVEQETEIVAKANKEYLEGEMPHEIYERMMKTMKPTSLPELVAVSKEMHTQARLEPEEKPAPTGDMQALAKAIESGDEVMLNQIVFNKKDDNTNAQPIPPPTQPV